MSTPSEHGSDSTTTPLPPPQAEEVQDTASSVLAEGAPPSDGPMVDQHPKRSVYSAYEGHPPAFCVTATAKGGFTIPIHGANSRVDR